jgi:hypothetical protein
MNNPLRDDPKPANVARVLDFPGFYESILSDGLDHAENMMVEGLIENYELPDEPSPYEACMDASTYATGFKLIARANVDWLNHVLDGTGIVLAYESMESPREYNFSTDALYVTVNDIELLASLTDPAEFEAAIKEHFTSRSGFHSFYSNDIEVWRAKPFTEWDHNELGTLLTTYLRQVAEDKGLDQNDMLEWMSEDFDNAVDEQTDFTLLYAVLGITND